MKTLDEVIKNLEDGTEHLSAMLISRETWGDALHYLRAFRDAKNTLEAEKDRYAEAVRNCEQAENKFRKMEDELNDIRREHIEQMKNPPLTWDELKAMEGKPVWVEQTMVFEEGTPEEYQQDVKEWMIISAIHNKQGWVDMVDVEDGELQFDRKDNTWKAYRKERDS